MCCVQVQIQVDYAAELDDVGEKLIPMMYQPWELCDDTFTEKSVANQITLPAKHTLHKVAAKY